MFLSMIRVFLLLAVALLFSSCTSFPVGLVPTSLGQSTDKKVVSAGQKSSPQQSDRARNTLIGKWHRRRPDSAGLTDSEITIFGEDGRFLFEMRRTDRDGRIVESFSEIGYWGVSGDVHFTIKLADIQGEEVINADSATASNYLAHKVLALSDTEFTYQTLVTGNIFTLKKVSDDFDFD